MALGRSFDDTNIPNYGEIILSSTTADKLDIINIHETIYISLPLNSSHIPLLTNYLNNKYFTNISEDAPELMELINDCNAVVIPFNVSYISEQSLGGKFAERSRKFDAVINMDYFMEMFMQNLPPMLLNQINNLENENDNIDEYNSETIYEYVTNIYTNLPPNRITTYLSTNYLTILSALNKFAGKIRYKIGWNLVDLRLDILQSMSLLSYTILSLSIVLDMIIFVLILLSVGLLYSLLVISVDSKKFMLGILRMLGMSKRSLVYLLISQSLAYSIPAYIIGMILAQIGVIYVSGILGSSGNVTLDTKLSITAIIIATVVGIGCSLVAAILPIISALQQNLRDVLDIRHSQTKAVKFNINRSMNFITFSWNTMCVCFVLVLFGWFIYYFLPQAFLSGNLSELSIMLFSLMLAMLFGFVLIGINMQHIIERIIVKIILFWEKRPIPNIVIKNLIAHRIRNRKTAVMYSLSLSFIFLVTVMISSNVEYMKVSELRKKGTKLQCKLSNKMMFDSDFGIGYQSMEHLLDGTGNFSNLTLNESIHQYIEDWAWRPWSFRFNFHDMPIWVDRQASTNIGKVFNHHAIVFGAVPNFESTAQQTFIKPIKTFDTSLTATELLHTAMGSQRVMIGEARAEQLKLKTLNDTFLLKFTNGNHDRSDDIFKMVKSLGWYKLYPVYNLVNGFWGWDIVIAPSAGPRMFGIESMEDLWMYKCFIKLKTNVINKDIAKIKKILEPTYCKQLWDYNVFSSEIKDSVTMLDLIFSMNTYMALFLCLFSLIASMSTNIIQQTKEIGILRSLGITKFQMNKIYMYESLILILSSSLIGMLIGCVLCFVVLKQQELFTNYPVDFKIPQSVIGATVTGAMITAVISVWFPLKNLNKKVIAQNLRDVC